MNKKQIIKEIDSWKFAECPTEKKEPFFWRWTKSGKEQIASYISDLLKAQRKEILEIIKKETNKLFVMEHEHDKNDTAYIPNSVDFEKKLIKIINSLK